MFSAADLERLKRELASNYHFAGSYPGASFLIYPQYAFSPPDSEQYARITRAPKERGDNGLRFWAVAELGVEGYTERPTGLISHFENAEFLPLMESEFNLLVANQCVDLVVPATLPIHQPVGFVSALALQTLKTDLIVSLIAEYEDEFLHFYWQTTA